MATENSSSFAPKPPLTPPAGPHSNHPPPKQPHIHGPNTTVDVHNHIRFQLTVYEWVVGGCWVAGVVERACACASRARHLIISSCACVRARQRGLCMCAGVRTRVSYRLTMSPCLTRWHARTRPWPTAAPEGRERGAVGSAEVSERTSRRV